MTLASRPTGKFSRYARQTALSCHEIAASSRRERSPKFWVASTWRNYLFRWLSNQATIAFMASVAYASVLAGSPLT